MESNNYNFCYKINKGNLTIMKILLLKCIMTLLINDFFHSHTF